MNYIIVFALAAITVCTQSYAQERAKDTTQTEELEEVTVSSTRTSRTIRNVPTRIEVIDKEELEEKSNMRPANVSMLLHESTGIQVQQTSATSANAGIRIQGLDGRYTQVLKDGIPNYAGFSGGLSILEIPPLDLKQVEVIKGPASTLYGGGSIAGVINFISIEPGRDNYTRLLLNQSHIGQSNAAIFTVQKKNGYGYTILATGNIQKAFDVDNDHFTELPAAKDITISPRFYIYMNEKSRLSIGHTFTTGERKGGDMQVIKKQADNFHTYFENNRTTRNITNLFFEAKWNEYNRLTARQSFSFFNRRIEIPDYIFKGSQINTYTDISNSLRHKDHILITGINLIYDHFRDKQHSSSNRDDKNTTAGLYIQDTWDVTQKLSFENGLRLDMTNRYGSFILPRISALYKISTEWSSRMTIGAGYKLPSMFTEQAEGLQYRNVLPLQDVKAERSYGGTADINFRRQLMEGLQLSVNQLFFYTIIDHPLLLQENSLQSYSFVNATGHTHTWGTETNLKFIFRDVWKLFAGYTWNETRGDYLTGNKFLPLVPRSKLNLALMYEKPDIIKIGLEGYYTGKQYLSNGDATPSFWEVGVMAEKPFKYFSLYINAENLTDTRQSRYKGVVNGLHKNPSFDEIWTHTEGFVLSGGIKIRW